MGNENEKQKTAHSNWDDIRIRNVSTGLKSELFNIATNNGETLSGFLKGHLRKIRDQYPDKERRSAD